MTVNSSIKSTNDISITNDEAITELNEDITSTDGSITVNSNDFTSDGNISAENGSVSIKAKRNITANGTVSAKDDISLASGNNTQLNNTVTSTDGSITANSNNFSSVGDISAENGSVSVDAKQNITTYGTVSANGDISLASGNDTVLNNTVTSETGSVVAKAGQEFTANGDITADSNVDITANKDATLNGSITGSNGSVSVNADNIATNNDIMAIDSIDLTADNQLNLNSGTIKSDTATMQAGTNINQQDGHSISAEDLTAQAATGVNIANSTNHLQNATVQNTGTGDVNVGNSGLHDVNIAILGKDDSNTINGSVDIHNYNNQDGKLTDLTVNSSFKATDDINIVNDEAGIQLDKDITSDTNVKLNTNNGDIMFNGDVTAQTGSINATVNEKGNIIGKDSTLNALNSENGKVVLWNKGEGDIDVHAIHAGNTARLIAKDGNIHVYDISGKLVAVAVRNPDKTANLEHVTADSRVTMMGNNTALDDFDIGIDNDGTIVIQPISTSTQKPIDYFKLGDEDIEIDDATGILFRRLWVKDADINLNIANLKFDKLFVEGTTHLSNGYMNTTVYGIAPTYDGSDTVYWNNVNINRPNSDLLGWINPLNHDSKWMYLYFTNQPYTQYSNGNLLYKSNGSNVYEQRFTATDLMSYLLSEQNNDSTISYYNRYNLYSLPQYDVSTDGEWSVRN